MATVYSKWESPYELKSMNGIEAEIFSVNQLNLALMNFLCSQQSIDPTLGLWNKSLRPLKWHCFQVVWHNVFEANPHKTQYSQLSSSQSEFNNYQLISSHTIINTATTSVPIGGRVSQCFLIFFSMVSQLFQLLAKEWVLGGKKDWSITESKTPWYLEASTKSIQTEFLMELLTSYLPILILMCWCLCTNPLSNIMTEL